jgi:acyl carrier protein
LITLEWPASTRLRFLLTGADTLHHYPRPDLPFALINNYGPTEATVVATSGRVLPQSGAERRPSIGRPIDNTTIYIVDESLHLTRSGETGELCIAGLGVAKGYVNSPELTAKKFVRDPFAGRPGARLYRTGDLARWLPDGEIEYVGRVDNLIKIRGYRIEPNEIVSVLNTHPAVENSAVVAREDGTGNLRMLAYVVINQAQASPSAGELRKLVRAHLPDYMVPAAFLEIPELPLNANGKLDREALPPPENSKMLLDHNYVPPQTALEERLSAVVAELLRVDRVGINDNFFLIGGHSLFGTQLIARIRDNFGVELPLRSVFESSTPALLARKIEELLMTRIDSMDENQIQRALEHSGARGGHK